MNATSVATKGIICCPCPGLIPEVGGTAVLRVEEEEIKRPLVMVKRVDIEETKEAEDLTIIEVTKVKFDNNNNNDED
jgi:hypothetical protein